MGAGQVALFRQKATRVEIWVVSFVALRVLALGLGFALDLVLCMLGGTDLHRHQIGCGQSGEIYTDIRANAAKMERLTQISESMGPK